ncbi:MAG: SDR family NAD(P)-dependent oxidoreductase [Bacteroidales bacterium]|nr:SDR family NAD(P)-dependent oxidoreductase [Bacteroidales bacterium]
MHKRAVKRKIKALGERLGHAPIALITGGSSGMGACYADFLAAAGCPLILVSNREDELTAKAEEIRTAYGVEVNDICMDLTVDGAAEELLHSCDQLLRFPDILILNAGIFFFDEQHPEKLARTQAMLKLHICVNTDLTVLFGERMKERGSGHILMVSSMAAKLPMPGISVYSATKAYLKSFAKSLYFELKPYGVGMTVVMPAAIATPLYGLKPSLMKFGVSIGAISTPQRLVGRALRAMLNGRRSIAPGLMNIYLPPLIALLPKRLVLGIWKRVMR